ncbi:MAG: hypothetical protein ACREFD_07445 [Stellaceae bacterium]
MAKKTQEIAFDVLRNRDSFYLRELVELLANQYSLPSVTVLRTLLAGLRSGLFDEDAAPGSLAIPDPSGSPTRDPWDDWLDGGHQPNRPTGWTYSTADMNGIPTSEPLFSDFQDLHDKLLELSPENFECGGYAGISIGRQALIRYFKRQTAWPIPDFITADSDGSGNRSQAGGAEATDTLSLDRAVAMFNERQLDKKSEKTPWTAGHIIRLFMRISPASLPGSDRWANNVLKRLSVERFAPGRHPSPDQDQRIMGLIEHEVPEPRNEPR